jgi:uncharacterized protein YjbI with pentapeptide repeats
VFPEDWSLVDGYLIGLSANLTGANLSGADLNRVISGGITGTPSALPAGWILVDGYLVGEAANLIDANLIGANLSGADL